MNIVINQMDRCAADGFVECVHWAATKTVGEYSASQYGTESFHHEEGQAYKPYDNLTQEDVKGWLTERWGVDGVAAKEAALDAQIQAQANPPVLAGLPWGV
jgi:hypothetical protein